MPGFTVQVLRFSADVGAMRRFLEELGLVVTTTSRSGGWVVLRGRAGAVALHDASSSESGSPAGHTDLTLTTGRAAAAADQLRGEGLPTKLWDESYGQQAAVTDPFGSDIWIDEEQVDLYGYRAHDADTPSAVLVTAVRYSPDFTADTSFFGRLGFHVDGPADEYWTALSASAESGVIGLHHPGDPVAATAPIELSFATSEPAQQLADRLAAAGHDARVVHDEMLGDVVHVTDPDGQALQVHQLS